MVPDSDGVQGEARRSPPAGVKVTPIPPPTIPYSFSATSSAPSGTIPAMAAAAPSATASPPPAASLPSPSVASVLPASALPPPNPPSSLPQKRALADEDHTPAVRSPLNPEARSTPKPTGASASTVAPGAAAAASQADDLPNVAVREKRAKKDSLKKRESKAAAMSDASGAAGSAGSRATPEPRRGDAGAADSGATNGSAAAGSDAAQQAAATKAAKVDEGLPVRVRLAGPLRPTDFDPPASPIFRSHHSVPVAGGEELEFFELLTEQPINRRGYVYESAVSDPRFTASHFFRQTEAKPHYAHISFEDAPPNVFFDHTGLHISGEGGFRTARANVGVRQGRWYWECKVTRGILREAAKDGDGSGDGEPPSRGHVRIGWARREASRDAPVGYDAYGYGIRDRKGQKVHMSRPKEFFSVAAAAAAAEVEGEDIREGDVIGLEIQLPSEALHRKVVHGTYNPAVDRDDDGDGCDGDNAPNILRDRIPFRFQTSKPVFEKFDYQPIRELEDLANPAPTLSSSGSGTGTGTGAKGGASKATKKETAASSALGTGGEPPNPNHAVPCLRTLPGSYIRVYKNGRLMGTPWTDLLAFLPPASTTNSKLQEGARERLDDGTLGYYPAVSVFRGGAAEVNFGPHFWYPPQGLNGVGGGGARHSSNDNGDVSMVEAYSEPAAAAAPSTSLLTTLRPAGERYAEQIAEDIVYDIVDEAYFWMLDGGRGGEDGVGSAAAAAAAAGVDTMAE